jgi:streptogramin lyase
MSYAARPSASAASYTSAVTNLAGRPHAAAMVSACATAASEKSLPAWMGTREFQLALLVSK